MTDCGDIFEVLQDSKKSSLYTENISKLFMIVCWQQISDDKMIILTKSN